MNTLDNSGYRFTITGEMHIDNVRSYTVEIDKEGRIATGIISERDGRINLLDLHFEKTIGLYGMYNFCDGLQQIAEEVLPEVLKYYNQSTHV